MKDREKAYRDKIIGAQFIEFLRKRLILLREILADDGSIYVHLDWKKGHYIKAIMDEVFGEHNFVNEIVWCYKEREMAKDQWNRKHDVIYMYKNSDKPIFKFYYDYDFGDGWEHEIKLEKIFTYDRDVKYPVCIDGGRRCPPEDCGGPGGYKDILTIIQDPEHKEYEEWMKWLGDEFDPEEFSLEDTNELLRRRNYGCIMLFA